MEVKKADDYQSWFIREGREALLIDPWFDQSLVEGRGWFLQRKKDKTYNLYYFRYSILPTILYICRKLLWHTILNHVYSLSIF